MSRLSSLERSDPELSAVYRRFLVAVAKANDAYKHDTGEGSVDSGTPAQKRQHKLWERRLDQADAIYYELMATPARTIEGMLLKIHVLGWHDEAPTSGYTPLIGAPDWTLGRNKLSQEKESILLDSLRSDLRGLQPKPDKLADELQRAIIDCFDATNKWGPACIVANRKVDARFGDPIARLNDPKAKAKGRAATAYHKTLTAAHRRFEQAAHRAGLRCEHLTAKIMERDAPDDLRARALILLYEFRPVGYDHEGRLSFPDDGGATRFLFDAVAKRAGIDWLVHSIESELQHNARAITDALNKLRRSARKGGAK